MAGKILLILFEEKGGWYFKSTNRLSTVKKNIEVSLFRRSWETEKNIIDHIIQIRKQAIPELDDSKKICKKCAYYDICFI